VLGIRVRVPLVDRRYDLRTLTVHIDLLGFLKVHNAMVNNIAVTRGDFDNLATMFDDPTWSYENMRSYFKRIEHNLDLDQSNLDHGFHGWLKTSLNPTSILANPEFAGATLIMSHELGIDRSSRSPAGGYNQHTGDIRTCR
jgi:choline dehydrogenase